MADSQYDDSTPPEIDLATFEGLTLLNEAIEARDAYATGHRLRVTLLAMLLASELGLEQGELESLRWAATFHDIGRAALDASVLARPGDLSDAERSAFEVCADAGSRMIEPLRRLSAALPSIRSCHERWDGAGYPDGLSGLEIPIGARIIAVAESWDAMTSERSFRPAKLPIEAWHEIEAEAGGQFDPRVVDAFAQVAERDPWMFGFGHDGELAA